MVGALEVDTRMFIRHAGGVPSAALRLEAALAIVYGRSILRWLDSDLFHDLVSLFIVVAVVGRTLSIGENWFARQGERTESWRMADGHLPSAISH